MILTKLANTASEAIMPYFIIISIPFTAQVLPLFFMLKQEG
jgi:uncharacterized membrane protein YcfT